MLKQRMCDNLSFMIIKNVYYTENTIILYILYNMFVRFVIILFSSYYLYLLPIVFLFTTNNMYVFVINNKPFEWFP